MRVQITLLSLLVSNTLALPAIHTVYVTEYTTVIVPAPTGANAGPATTAAAVAATPVEDAAAKTTSVGLFGKLFNGIASYLEGPASTTSVAATTAIETSLAAVATTETPLAAPKVETTLGPVAATTVVPQAPTTTSATPSATGEIFSGQGTFYDTGLGACGIVNTDTDYIAAISHELYDAHNIDGNPNHNPLCGKKIRAFYQGKSVEIAVTDRCEGCKYNDLDFSPSAFDQLADADLGRINITWEWV
ncbi:RlpA-like double-psi beta-barrel-protein domain-containing protein-containing protein [Scheffersomyces xylosifermentans]|uniref:RlpA-like double-psi beta-barrel-protein domain-containing protein-containing protein n=1 Tax=Scheffersomyces xylosifermentans TaxID=1304137 RepID=UPI00315DF422